MATKKAEAVEVVAITAEVALKALKDPSYQLPKAGAEDAVAGIIDRIMAATDAASVSDAASAGTESWKDFLGVPFILKAVRFAESTFEEGPTVYALVDAIDEDGAPRLLTIGSTTALAQLVKLDTLGVFPTERPWVLHESERPTAAGFYPRWLEEVPA